MSVFDKYRPKAFPFRFHGTMHVDCIAGGIPTDPKVAEGWLRSKLDAPDDIIREEIAKTMVERGVTVEEATEIVGAARTLNGFKRDEQGLYIEGRQLKAALKEAAWVAANAGKLNPKGWGSCTDQNLRKGLKNWLPEHVFVEEDRLHLGVEQPSGVMQRFVHTFRGTGISYEEYVLDAKIDFTVITDFKFTDEQWAMIWLFGEQQGIGASRSQGYGRYQITAWEPIK